MNIDERLEALTMNLELAHRDIQDLYASMRSTAAAIAANTEAIAGNAKSIAELRAEGAAERERIELLVASTANLLTVSQSHEDRLQRLERRTG